MVMFHHIEKYKHHAGLPNLMSDKNWGQFVHDLGLNGVLVFFTLSGFLITYLLLAEHQNEGTIDVKKFYFRRILRIWPVYFIVVGIGFMGMPWLMNTFPDFFLTQKRFNSLISNLQFEGNLLLFVFFMSNMAMGKYNLVAGASQSWSVSVEEQFYLIWPWVVLFFRKHLVLCMLLIVIVVQVVQHLQYLIPAGGNFKLLGAFISSFHIDYMATGGIMAWLYFNRQLQVQSFIKKPYVLALALAAGVLQFVFKSHDVLKACTFAILIVSAIEWGWVVSGFNFLGKISYGLYMYHPLVMYLIFAAASQWGFNFGPGFNLFVYSGVFGITVLISLLSYKWVELPMLRLKEGVSKVRSGKIEI